MAVPEPVVQLELPELVVEVVVVVVVVNGARVGSGAKVGKGVGIATLSELELSVLLLSGAVVGMAMVGRELLDLLELKISSPELPEPAFIFDNR